MVKVAEWITRYELWFLGMAVPLLLFPMGALPFVGLGLIGLTWLCRKVSRGRWSTLTGVEIPSLILVGMAVVGYGISVEPGLSKARFWNILLDLAVFYGLANGLRPGKQVGWVAGGLSAAALGVVGLGLLGTDWESIRFFELPWLYEHIPTLIRGLPNSGVTGTSDLFNPRWVGITLGALAPVLLAGALWLKNIWLRLLSGATAILTVGLLLLTQTLQGVVGMCAGVFFLLVWRSRGWLLLLVLGLGGLIGGVVLIGPEQLGQVLLSRDNPVGIAIVLRLDIWSRALAMIGDLPFTGIGLNTFSLIQTHFYPGYLLGPEPHAHNLYLQTALDLGMPGLAGFGWFFIAWGVRVWRNAHSRGSKDYHLLLAGIAAGVVAYLAHGWMDAMMMGAKPSVLIWGLMGVAAASPEGETAVGTNPTASGVTLPRKTRAYLQALPLLLMVGIGLTSILLKPESLLMNLGAVQAHKGLYAAQTTGVPEYVILETAKVNLLAAQSQNPGYTQAYELLGRIYAWQGDHAKAMQALAYRVATDDEDVMLRYFPSGGWLRQIQGADTTPNQDWIDLIDVYSQWNTRFSERAPTYAEIGLAWQCARGDLEQAESVVQRGIDQGAMPTGLLVYYRDQLLQKNNDLCEENH